MSKLPRISSKDFIKYITKRGFVYDHTSGSHHIYKRSDDRMVSVPERKEIGQGLLLDMIEQIGKTREEFMTDWYGHG